MTTNLDIDSDGPEVPRGPRGGVTTVTHTGKVKKNLWIGVEDAEVLRQLSFETRLPEAEIIRQGLKWALENPALLESLADRSW